MLTTIVFHGPPPTQMSRNSRWMSGSKHPTGNQTVLVETGDTFEALATQGAGTRVGLTPAPAVADVADEPPRNGRLLTVKRAGACTAEARSSNPLRSTR
jgi:hypothetical protein